MAQRKGNLQRDPAKPKPADMEAKKQNPEMGPVQAQPVSAEPAIDAGHLYPNGAERMAYMILDRDNKETRVISEMIEDGPVRRMTFVEPKLANRPAFLRGHDST